MKKTISRIKGFTIVELLVVIAIIALLTGIVTTSLSPAKAKGRDAKRVSDLGQIQLALELYFDRCKEYPASLSISEGCTTSSGNLTLGDFISKIPAVPSGTAMTDYWYAQHYTGQEYLLKAQLEKPNSVRDDDSDITEFEAEEGDPKQTACSDDTLLYYCLSPK